MTKTDIVKMVSELLTFAKDVPEATPEMMAPADAAPVSNELTTKDGIVISTTAEKWDVGVDVTIDGQPAPDGEYLIVDGSTVKVVEGKVTEITAIEETPEAEPAEAEMGKPKEVTTTTTEKLTFAAEDKYKELELKFNKVLEATTILVEAFNKLPVTDKIVMNATSTNSEEEFGRHPVTRKEKNLKEMAAVLEEIKAEQNKKNNK